MITRRNRFSPAISLFRGGHTLAKFLLPSLWMVSTCVSAQQSAPAAPATVLFQNVHVFDGKSASLSELVDVRVKGNKIEKISASGVEKSTNNTIVIAGQGRTLMPGLIDAHWHAMMAEPSMTVALTADVGYLNLLAAQQAQKTLLRGFTSVRDLAGPAFSLKKAIDQGIVIGPRIWPSGAMISQTGGHGDYRQLYELPQASNAHLSHAEVMGAGVIADGRDQVLKRAREQLMMGASQLKLAAGGGVASHYDPIDVSQYTEDEFRAAVEAAENWGTYVTVHAYTPRAIQTAIRGGVKNIDHGQLIDEETAKIIAQKGVWLNMQPFLDDEDANPYPEGSNNRTKQLEMFAGTDNAYRLAKKYRIKLAWGTDILFDANLTNRQGAQLAKMTRWFTPAEVLRMATSTNAELLTLSGRRNPYPGKLGVIEEGALADLLLVQGNPILNIKLIEDPEANFVVIMKDGKIYKNSIKTN